MLKISLSALFACCVSTVSLGQSALEIMQASVHAHGGLQGFEHINLRFKQADKQFEIKRDNGSFQYSRTHEEGVKELYEVLNNSGFTCYKNGDALNLSFEDSLARCQEIKNVAYFTLLPFPILIDEVGLQRNKDAAINKAEYYVVEVSYNEKGGKIFSFWVNKQSNLLDYFAFNYFGATPGMIFCAASDRENMNGFVVQDYQVYSQSGSFNTLDWALKSYVKKSLQQLDAFRMEGVSIERK